MILEYRKCEKVDLPLLVRVSKKTFCDAFEKDNDPEDFNSYITKAFSLEQISSELENPNTGFYFVYAKETLVAYFKLNKGDAQSDVKLVESQELERIYVIKEFQSLGLGETILNKIKDLALKSNKCFVWLGVWEENVSAIRFYERHGFYKFGTHPYFIGKDKQTDWLMRFDLINFHSK